MSASFRQLIGALPSTASPQDSVLIIIDAQNEYAEGALRVSNVTESRVAIAALLEKYRSAGGEIVHICAQVPEKSPLFTPDTRMAEVFDELKPRSGEKVIWKPHPSSFADTDLHDYLQTVNAKKVVLTGYMAHVCVSTTARDAARYGYDTIVARDCIGDRDIPGASGPDVANMVLVELADFFATIVNSNDIV